MKRFLFISFIFVSSLLTFSVQCHADGHGHYSHGGGSDWGDFAAGMTLGILGMGVFTELTRPRYPPPQLYVQPVPREVVVPGYMYYCVYSSGYYPYTPGCPGGWVQIVPIPQPPPR